MHVCAEFERETHFPPVSLNSNNKSGTRGIYRWKSASGVWYWKAIINNNIGHQLQRLFREEDVGFKKAIDQSRGLSGSKSSDTTCIS